MNPLNWIEFKLKYLVVCVIEMINLVSFASLSISGLNCTDPFLLEPFTRCGARLARAYLRRFPPIRILAGRECGAGVDARVFVVRIG